MPTEAPELTQHDPVVAEVIGNRLTNVALEMATTLMRTSGSPVLTEAKDFCNAVFDRNLELVGFSGYVVLHIGSATEGVRAVSREYGDDLHPYDAFICNDPYTAGAIHQGDVGIVTPLFWQDELVGWAFSNAHVFDVGGMSPGGWAPVAWDCYGEALRFPPLRIVERGEFVRDIERMLLHNVRMPIVLNDIKSLVAANNCAQTRIGTLLDEYGLETYERYAEVNKALSEKVVRERIETLPDGVFEAVDWVEYDGHGTSDLIKIHAKLGISGSDLVIDLQDTDPQSDGFVNAGFGAVAGQLGANVLLGLAYDVPTNAGILRPISVVLPDEGTMLNPMVPAPVSCGHMEGAMRMGRIFWEAFSKAAALSTDAAMRGRVLGSSPFAWPGNSWTGTADDGSYAAFAVLDVSSGGLGAQTVGDGIDVGAIEHMLDAGIPDVEINESYYPMLYLWRRLNTGSGGPGLHRGGLGLEIAWTGHGVGTLTGTLENATGFIPSRGSAGGYPGSTCVYNIVRGTNIRRVLEEGRAIPQDVDALGGREEPTINHTAGVPLELDDVFHQFMGGGSGTGDPLLRGPERVAADVHAGYVRAEHARTAYGVVLDDSGEVDGPATQAARAAIREARLGRVPQREPDDDGRWRPAIELRDGFCCSRCGEVLGADADWKSAAVRRDFDLVDRLAEFGLEIQRHEVGIRFYEWACPSCATLLETNIYVPGYEPLHDLRLGADVASEVVGNAGARRL
jgi:N-methylhydantoinase B